MVKTQKTKSSVRKPTIRKNIKMNIEEKYNKTIIEEFRKVYCSILFKMSSNYRFHDDSAIFYETFMQRHFYSEFENINYLYQPKKDGFDDFEKAYFIVIFDKKVNLTNLDKVMIKKTIDDCNKLYIKDFENILKNMDNKWYKPLETPLDVQEILNITSDLVEISKNKWKMTFDPVNSKGEGSFTNCWYPIEISKIIEEYTPYFEEHNLSLKEYDFKYSI